ncbi:translation initiation factor IF-2 [Zea mays]|uniref:translation initiation factor IF-2 n=1 Tax=Zea mays TaxID=4577 RepID=UPI0009A9955B|nr:translation initiation factor IF-2-like [Zea mays]XP_035821070.1 translation initiation factor IF-2-like [Zea mays]XP_035821071.1 translation initiation factor IF-2-like [Zea mays]XP_035821072.1 translation initiation factor IF-2-like [Zea mays]XP_035821073.1 translation initiation factor IF-2-like [Zea mays]XP_035821074.1 translation initiation factor IF-2-like [Zea mays]XP_035821075.1 translation initiation factor IF-2-like [Zea mays]XP_035821076.1 translation initiation factor IF-2-lik
MASPPSIHGSHAPSAPFHPWPRLPPRRDSSHPLLPRGLRLPILSLCVVFFPSFPSALDLAPCPPTPASVTAHPGQRWTQPLPRVCSRPRPSSGTSPPARVPGATGWTPPSPRRSSGRSAGGRARRGAFPSTRSSTTSMVPSSPPLGEPKPSRGGRGRPDLGILLLPNGMNGRKQNLSGVDLA